MCNIFKWTAPPGCLRMESLSRTKNTKWQQHNSATPQKMDLILILLTCLFLSSVIRWIWIFFLPMMLCSCGDKRSSQPSGDVPLRGWEMKCSLRPRTSVQKHSRNMHPRTHARTHFSAQVWWGYVVSKQQVWRVGAAEMCETEEWRRSLVHRLFNQTKVGKSSLQLLWWGVAPLLYHTKTEKET